MRFLCAMSLLLAVILAMCHWEGEAVEVRTDAPSWVRTVDGWERPETWEPVTAPEPIIHPGVVAAGQLLASLAALVVYSWPTRKPRTAVLQAGGRRKETLPHLAHR